MFMKFVKANVALVVSLAIVLVVLCLLIPIMSMDADRRDIMNQRITQVQAANALITTIDIPGIEPMKRATFEDNVYRARKNALDVMKEQAQKVREMTAEKNSEGRIEQSRGPRRAGEGHEIPLLAGKIPMDHLLPRLDDVGNPYDFKGAYQRQFTTWREEIKGNAPYTLPELLAMVLEENKKQQANAAGPKRIFADAGGGNQGLSTRQTIELKRAKISERASDIHCYLDADALQKREWALPGRTVPPTEPEIFEALVDTWFQQDVLHAIQTVNDSVLEKQSTPDQNVGHAPIKRLEKIVVGTGALVAGSTAPGNLFVAGGTPGASDANRNPDEGMYSSTPAPAPVGGVDTSRSLTGHISTPDFDVVPMRIIIYMDPAYQNTFIDALYKANNGYTVLNVNLQTVDPVEAATHGYLFGRVQCVRLDIQVEGLLFRSWTEPLMPREIKAQLGITETAPAGGGMRGR